MAPLSAKPWSYLILAGSLLVLLLVQVLPLVDLPDSAFQQDTDLVEVQTRSIATPQALVVALLPSLFFPLVVGVRRKRALVSVKPERKSILIFEHVFRC